MIRFALLFVLSAVVACGRIGFDDRAGDIGDSGIGASSDASIGNGDAAGSGTGAFGKTEVGISTQNTGADRVWISRFTLTEAAQVQSLVAYLSPTGAQSSSVRGIIYMDATDKPSALLGTTTDVMLAGSSQAGWMSLPFAAPVSLAPGTYWLGTHNSIQLGIAYQSATGASKRGSDIFSDGTDATYGGAAQTFTLELSIYAEYTR